MAYRKKLKKMIKIFINIFIFSFIFNGCWYYSMKGSLPAHISSIFLSPVTNESAEFLASEIFNEEINKFMVTENVLDIVGLEDADSQLDVVILSVTDKPYTITLSEVGMEEVEEWKLTVKIMLQWYDLKRDEILITKQMSSWGSYTPGIDIGTDGLDNDGDSLIDDEDSDENGSPRESALGISVRRLTNDIVNEITNTW